MSRPWLDGPLDLECSWVTFVESLAGRQLKTLDNNAAVEVDAGIARIRFIPDAPATEDSHPERPGVRKEDELSGSRSSSLKTRGSILPGSGGHTTKTVKEVRNSCG